MEHFFAAIVVALELSSIGYALLVVLQDPRATRAERRIRGRQARVMGLLSVLPLAALIWVGLRAVPSLLAR